MRRGAFVAGLSFVVAACGGGTSGAPTQQGAAGATPSTVALDGGVDAPSPAVGDAAPQGDASLPSAPSGPCVGKPVLSAGDATWAISFGGQARSVNVHVPARYDGTRAIPVVLNFHGYTSDPVQQAQLTAMSAKSDAEGFIVAYPKGTGALLSWNAGACCGTAAQDGTDDVGFTGKVLDEIESKLCVDANRVYATGMSNGGFLSNRLGCEMSTRIAAIAPVAGVLGVPTCTPSRPVPVMHFHGTSDPLVPYDGNASIGYVSVADSIAGWVSRDACTAAPTTTYQKGDATCVTHGGCANGAEVTLCTIDGGGHTWPGGTPVPALGKTSTDISATDAMWEFFRRYTL